MKCIVTAGPTYEPLDEVRRLTNFSTGRLGCILAEYLGSRAHNVTLFLARGATYRTVKNISQIIEFTTTENLMLKLQSASSKDVNAIFHAAAVSDYKFGKIFCRNADGSLKEIKSGKIPTEYGEILAELKPTPKIISNLRRWFPNAKIFGWKYEVDGNRDTVIKVGLNQIEKNNTDAAVLNGPAYGNGFGVLTKDGNLEHCPNIDDLVKYLASLVERI